MIKPGALKKIQKIKKLQEQNEALIDFCIFLSKVYQKNYETFADCSNVDYSKNVTDERKEEFIKYMYEFSTVQGYEQRKLVADLSKRERLGKTFKQITEALGAIK